MSCEFVQMAAVFPRWKVILVGICSLVLSCLLLLTVFHVSSFIQPDVKARQLVLSPVVLSPSRRRLAEENSSQWGDASRHGYTPLEEPTVAISPTGISIVRITMVLLRICDMPGRNSLNCFFRWHGVFFFYECILLLERKRTVSRVQ